MAGTASWVNLSKALVVLGPPGVVTVRSTTPATPAGEVALSCVAELTAMVGAANAPKLTPSPR